MEWGVDRSQTIPVGLFVRGYRYTVLGLFATDLHLFGVRDGGPPEGVHLLGTDRLGRDQWSRLMFGTRTSMTVGLVAVALSVVLGVVLGGVSGYFGGLTVPEIAEACDRPQGTVKTHLHRGLLRLRERLDAAGAGR